MKRNFVSAALASLMGVSAIPAAASPAPAPISVARADLIQVQAGRPDGRGDRRPDGRRFTPGHRYDSAPSHWRRYHSRPRDWSRRGCIIVGPVWFCP